MEAVLRLMTGKEERTIAEKFADANRPTWEQYKKDNQDKLDIQGADDKKMQAYRKELDEERDKILSRGINHGGKKKKRKKHYDSSDTDDSRKRSKKKHKKYRKKKHKKHHSSSDDSDSSDSDSDDSRRKRKHKTKKRKSKKKSGKKEESEDDRYRLSKFFTQGSDED